MLFAGDPSMLFAGDPSMLFVEDPSMLFVEDLRVLCCRKSSCSQAIFMLFVEDLRVLCSHTICMLFDEDLRVLFMMDGVCCCSQDGRSIESISGLRGVVSTVGRFRPETWKRGQMDCSG